MKAQTTPPIFDPDPSLSIGRLILDRCAMDPQAPQARYRQGDTWIKVTAHGFAARVRAVAKGFMASGIAPGQTVGLMGRTGYGWSVADIALWLIGAVPVPIYETSSAEQTGWIVQDAALTAVLVESHRHLAQVEACANWNGQSWVFDDAALDHLAKDGQAVSDQALDQRAALVKGDDLATIIYTSGTTGRPKGTELTHQNFCTLARNTIVELQWVCYPGSRILMFLPLAHVFARMINVIILASPGEAGYSPDTRDLVADLAGFKPTGMLVVPRVLEKVYNSAEASTGGGAKQKLFRWAAKVAIVHSRSRSHRRSLGLKLQHRVADRLVYRKLRRSMGGALTLAISGGAPLGERLGHFFRGIGLTVYEGYGLTETSAPTGVNRIHCNKIGTVGPPLPGQTVAVADDGEILVRGPHVFRGYHNDPKSTAEALRDGWFHTGDIGWLDNDGYLTITGRRKELIVTAGGKNVAPSLLEDRLRGHPLVSQVVVVGDNRPFVAALITLDAEMLPGWLASHGKEAMTVSQAMTDPDILQSLDRAVGRTNKAVSRAESIRQFTILEGDFTEANGYLTPSLKVKRVDVLRDFADQIDRLYARAEKAKVASTHQPGQ